MLPQQVRRTKTRPRQQNRQKSQDYPSSLILAWCRGKQEHTKESRKRRGDDAEDENGVVIGFKGGCGDGRFWHDGGVDGVMGLLA